MNRSLPLLLAITLVCGASQLRAQLPADTIWLGPNYANQVYYSVSDGSKHTVPLAGWDIAFELTGFSSSILINGGSNVNLYVVPGKMNEDFGTAIDTTGMYTWEHPMNALATWSSGAFNLGRDYNTGDFGWGEYNMNTHKVTGTSLYVITLPNGDARQITVDGLSSGTYTFRTAMLDGTGIDTNTVTKTNFANHHFAYYSISGDSAFNNEPEMENWDLVFTKYIDVVMDMQYGVTGVLSAPGVTIAQVTSTTPATEPAPATEAYSDSINVLGYDWKTFDLNAGGYAIKPNVVYFVHAKDDNIYRLVMTGFAGGSTGQVTFQRQAVSTVSVKDRANRSVGSVAVAPNVVRAGETSSLVLDLNAAHAVRVAVVNAAGRTVATHTVSGTAGLQALRIGEGLESGSYLVAVEIDGVVNTSRLIVQ